MPWHGSNFRIRLRSIAFFESATTALVGGVGISVSFRATIWAFPCSTVSDRWLIPIPKRFRKGCFRPSGAFSHCYAVSAKAFLVLLKCNLVLPIGYTTTKFLRVHATSFPCPASISPDLMTNPKDDDCG
jgi:hypothetical protein